MTALAETTLLADELALSERFVEELRGRLKDELHAVCSWMTPHGTVGCWCARRSTKPPVTSSEFLEAARRRLAAAEVTVEEDPSTALSAAYYAMLYGARATLSERDISAKTHRGSWHIASSQRSKRCLPEPIPPR